MFTKVDNEVINKPITMEQISKVLHSFSRDKYLGLDRWTVEILLHFLDIMGNDLLSMVEESRPNR